MTFRRPRDAERGAAAVEFALVSMILMLLVMGMIDFGYYFYVDHVVTNAAREGARAGSLWPTPQNTAATTDATNTANNYLLRGGLNLSNASVTVTFDTAGTPPAPTVKVLVTYTTGSLTGFLGSGLIPSSANALSEMRR